MSVELLRKAAALMQERAEAASGGAWRVDREETRVPGCVEYLVRSNTYGHIVVGFGEGSDADRSGDAEHIASWHPVVALAVADVLRGAADELDGVEDPDVALWFPAELAVARAYLGESA